MRIRITADRLSITSARLPPLVIWMLTAVANSFRSVLRAVSATRRMESCRSRPRACSWQISPNRAPDRLGDLLGDGLKGAHERMARPQGPGGNAQGLHELPLEQVDAVVDAFGRHDAEDDEDPPRRPEPRASSHSP